MPSVNYMPTMDRERLAPYADELRRLPFVRSVRLRPVPAGKDAGHDALAELRLADGSTTVLHIELKTSHLRSPTVSERRSTRGAAREDVLLAAPHIGAPLGESLEQRGINFIDRQGNCYLRVGDRFVARIQGKTSPKPPARSREMRAPGYQVLFALLADPELVHASQREIATSAGTSKQPVADLLRRLTEERILVQRGRKHAWVKGPDAELMERFVAGYRDTLRPKLMVGRFRLPVREPREVERWLQDHLETVRFGGTAGAYRLAPHYRGALTVAHLGPPSPPLRKRLKALPAVDGELIWMRHIGQASEKGETGATVHPLLVYAELISDPDPRASEAAGLIRERWLPWSL